MGFRFQLEDRQALAACQSALAAGGLHVPLTGEAPPLFGRVEVEVEVSGVRAVCQVAGQVVNHAPQGGFFVQLEPGGGVDALVAAVEEALAARAEASEPRAPEGPLGGGRRQLLDPASTVPLHQQVGELTVQEKIRVARTANRPVRRLLIRDVDKRVHVAVIKNPSVTDDEMVEYTGIGGLSPAALSWVASQRQLLRNRRTLMNVVINPMTPQNTALKLLGMLHPSELLVVSRSGRVRQAVQRAAKKKLMASGTI